MDVKHWLAESECEEVEALEEWLDQLNDGDVGLEVG